MTTTGRGEHDTETRAPACHYCGSTDEEMRPYGPGGSAVCFPCATATPEREAATSSAFGALLDAAESISVSGAVAIGEPGGPRPFDPREASRRSRQRELTARGRAWVERNPDHCPECFCRPGMGDAGDGSDHERYCPQASS